MLEKSLKHKGQPLFTYLNPWVLKESNAMTDNLTSAQGNIDSVHINMNLAFMQLESRLSPSLQEVITCSIGSLKNLLSLRLDHFTLKLMSLLKESNNLK